MQVEVGDPDLRGVQRADDLCEVASAVEANGDLAEIVRALDAEGVRISHLQIHDPTLDDVFLAKTGRHLEGAGDEEQQEESEAPAPAPA